MGFNTILIENLNIPLTLAFMREIEYFPENKDQFKLVNRIQVLNATTGLLFVGNEQGGITRRIPFDLLHKLQALAPGMTVALSFIIQKIARSIIVFPANISILFKLEPYLKPLFEPIKSQRYYLLLKYTKKFEIYDILPLDENDSLQLKVKAGNAEEADQKIKNFIKQLMKDFLLTRDIVAKSQTKKHFFYTADFDLLARFYFIKEYAKLRTEYQLQNMNIWTLHEEFILELKECQ